MPTPEEILTDLNTNILPAVADLTNSVQTAITAMNALRDKAAVQTDKADELFSLAPADVTMPNGDIVPNFAKVRDDLQATITAFTSVAYLEATATAVDSAKLEGKTLLEISNSIKSDIIDGAPAIYDTLKEISDALGDDDTAINNLLTQLNTLSTSLTDLATVVADKAPAVHEHDSRYYTKSQTDTAIDTAVATVTAPLPDIAITDITNITGIAASVVVDVAKFGYAKDLKIAVDYRKQGEATWTRSALQSPTGIGTLSVDLSGLSVLTAYEVQAVAIDTKNPDISVLSPILPFSTPHAHVATPTVSISGGNTDISTMPTLSTSEFSAVGVTDTHFATTWRAKRADGTVDWESVANTTDKTSITIPYGYLQHNTTYSFEVIHIGQTLGASAVGSISAATTAIPLIGVAGSVGFGVGVAPDTLVTAFGLTPMTGYNDPTHPNFGNYTDASGSVMVYIPKHYVKLSANTAAPYNGLQVDISGSAKAGYSLPRCFVNNGVEVAGIFVDKYLGGKEGTVMVSKRNLDPVSTNSGHNPITALTANSQAPAATYEGMYAAVKTRGANYSLTTIFTYTMLANLADAHYQACYRNNNFAPCAWADIGPYQPKGCNNNALKDVNDANVVYTTSGYSNCGLTGGVTDAVFAKIAHNGQKCGVVDLNGNMWEVAAGYITSAAGAHLVLKESIDVKNLTAAVAYTTTNYDALTMPLTLSNTQVGFGNGTNQFFSGDTVRTNNAYRLDNLGLPLNDNAVSTSGTNRFGQDGFWRYQANEMCPIVGGHWADSGLSGVRARALGNVRSRSDGTVGGRACLVPSVAG